MINYKYEFWSYSNKDAEKVRDEICERINLPFDIMELWMQSFIFILDSNDNNIFDIHIRSEKHESLGKIKVCFRCTFISNIESNLMDLEFFGKVILEAIQEKVFYAQTLEHDAPIKNLEIIKVFDFQ